MKNKKYFVIFLTAAVVFNFLFLPITALAQTAPTTPTTPTAPTAPATPAAPGIPKDDSNGGGGGLVSWMKGSAILFISSVISSILGGLFGIILYIEAQIIDYVLSPNNFSFTSSPVVTLGWGITRDLSNMFLILILLVIAFATVLKIQSYAIKQLWWKVVAVALLINFSLVFAGVIIDFAQVMTNFFLKQALGGDTNSVGTITTRLAQSMQILNFYNPQKGGILGGLTQFGADAIAAVLGIILTLVGLIITVFVFGATAIFLVVRILYIWFLLIALPIVCMFWILPSTSGYFNKWWGAFVNWTFFAPAYMFMIYLSLSMFDAAGKLKEGVLPASSNPAAWNAATPGLTTVGMPSAIFQWILVIAMMFGSLIVAKSFGVMFAGESEKMLTGWGDKAKGLARRQLQRRIVNAGATPATETEKAKAGWLVRGAQRIAGLPGGKLLAGQAFKMAAGEAKTAEEAQKQFSDWTPEAIKAYLDKQPGAFTSPFVQSQRIGAALALKEKGKLDTMSEAQLRDLASLASRSYPKQLDEILKVAPNLAVAFKKTIKEIVAKIEKANEVSLDALKDAEVAINFNPQQLKTVVQKAGDEKIATLKETVNTKFDSLNQLIRDRIDNEIIGARNKDARNQALRKLEEDERTGTVPVGAAKIARAKFTTGAPAWET